jgi:hypothetical protein
MAIGHLARTAFAILQLGVASVGIADHAVSTPMRHPDTWLTACLAIASLLATGWKLRASEDSG